MHILIINWRSINDPRAGGAERATFEHAKRWVKNHGAHVTWVSPKYKRELANEIIEGVDFFYPGIVLPQTPYRMILAFMYFYFVVFINYVLGLRKKVDVVIDEAHGVPYLTALYVGRKKVVFVCEVAGIIWDKMFAYPLNKIGAILERLAYIPYKLKKIKIIAISESTKNDLIKLGLAESQVTTVFCGVEQPRWDFSREPKEQVPTLMMLSRLVKMKGLEEGLELFKLVKSRIENAQLWIIGTGDEKYITTLKALVKEHGLEDAVTFFGFVQEEEKYRLLAQAHALINPSTKEGWGLNNLEANTQGTPAVAYKVPGNIESIKDGFSGYLAKKGDRGDFVDKVIRVLDGPSLRETCKQHTKQYDWDIMAERFYQELKNA